MKLFNKLNQRGVAHYILPLVVVVGVAIVGVALLVASHADTPGATGNGWTYIGQRSFPQQNETLTVYACEGPAINSVRQVEGLFKLSRPYKDSGGFTWTASIINGSTAPVPGFQSIYKNISSADNSSVELQLNVSTKTSNPLSFSYSAGTPDKGGTALAGNIAQNRYPSQFATCLDKP